MKTLNDFNIKSKKPWEVEGVEWKEVRLGEIGFLQYGYTQKAKYDKIGPKFLRITDIDLETSQVNWDKVPYCYIDEKNYTKYKLKDGDILIARIGGTTGKACIIKNPPECVFASYLIRFSIVDKENISPEFIYYFTKSRKYWDQIALGRIGKLKEGVNATQLKNLKIPLPIRNGKPDLETQKKIVEYIEANFSRIDKILEKKKREIEWLDELWESVLEQAFKPKEGEEWREVRLKEVVKEVKSGFALSKRKRMKVSSENGIPQLRPYNIANWNKIDLSQMTYVPGNIENIEDYFIRDGDVLFNNTNSIELVGRAAVFKESSENYTYSNHITRLRIKDPYFPEYVSWAINSLWLKGVFYLKATKWIGQAGISNKKLLSIKIPLPFRNNHPDLEKQKEIANYLDGVYEKTKTLKEKIQNQITQLEEMKESILDEVFNHGDK